MGLLYCITNKVNSKIYVGITRKSMDRRWQRHVDKARRAGYKAKFHNAIVKYGVDAFVCTPLFVYPTWDEAKAAEKALIHALDSMNVGYNASPGADCGPERGKKRTPEQRAKFKAAAQRRAADPLWREKMRQVAIERAKNPEYIAKLSAALTGRRHSAATRAKLSAGRRNKLHTAETKEKMSKSRVGYRHTDKARENMSLAQKGRTLSQEHRDKISATLVIYNKRKKELQSER